MSLFKVYRGTSDLLPKTLHDGYAYFCADTGEFFIDVDLSGNGSGLERVQLNALAATKLKKGLKTIEIDDIVLTSDAIVHYDGEGGKKLELNAVLVGNGTDTVKVIPATPGAFIVDSLEEGPKFDIVPLTAGGTGGNDAETARNNLDVYSKKDIDDKLKNATTVSYTATLAESDWADNSGDGYVLEYKNDKLKCGAAGNVPPEITFETNREEYSKIDHAVAEPREGIKFYIDTKPTSDIDIIIIDQL